MQAGGNYAWPRCEGTLPAGCRQAGDIAPGRSSTRTRRRRVRALGDRRRVRRKELRPVRRASTSSATTSSSKIYRAPLNGDPRRFRGHSGRLRDRRQRPDRHRLRPRRRHVLRRDQRRSGRRVTPNYARPQAATPLPAARAGLPGPVGRPTALHAPPRLVAARSCNPPAQTSGNLTVGTPDANGAAANSSGFVKLSVCPVPGCTAPDVRIQVSMEDVRCKAGVSASVRASANTAGGADYSARPASSCRSGSPTRTTRRRPEGRARPRRWTAPST